MAEVRVNNRSFIVDDLGGAEVNPDDVLDFTPMGPEPVSAPGSMSPNAAEAEWDLTSEPGSPVG